MPQDFQLFRSERPEVFIPSTAGRHSGVEILESIVRLRRGITPEQAEQDLAASMQAGENGHWWGKDVPHRVVDLRSRLFGDRPELMLAGAVIFVLLIARQRDQPPVPA
jgi:hypothetical protein